MNLRNYAATAATTSVATAFVSKTLTQKLVTALPPYSSNVVEQEVGEQDANRVHGAAADKGLDNTSEAAREPTPRRGAAAGDDADIPRRRIVRDR